MILEKLFERRGRQVAPAQDSFGGGGFWMQGSASGEEVTEESAQTFSALQAAIRVLSESIATLPFPVYERTGEDSRRKAREHPLYPIINDEPNSEMSAVAFWSCMMFRALLRGNGYAEIERNRGDGRVIAMWPIHPDRVSLKRIGGELVYRVSGKGGNVTLRSEDMFDLRALASDGLRGRDLTVIGRDSIGLSLAAQRFGAMFFGNGSQLTGWIERPKEAPEWGEKAQARFKEEWAAGRTGRNNLGTAILEEGMKWHQSGVAPENAQFLETRDFQNTEASRLIGTQPHLIGDLRRATFSNIEHQGIEFVVHSVRPWAVRIEQEVKRKLIPLAERATFFAEINLDGLQRGDMTARFNAYRIGREMGHYTANDTRRLENENPIGPEGDVHHVPLNWVPMGSAPAAATEGKSAGIGYEQRAGQAAAIQGRKRLEKQFLPLFRDAATRLVKKEANAVRAAIKTHFRSSAAMPADGQAVRAAATRDAGSFTKWLAGYYGESFEQTVRTAMAPVIKAYSGAIADGVITELGAEPVSLDELIDSYVDALSKRYAGSSRGQLEQIIEDVPPENLRDALGQRVDEWEEKRPEKLARRETARAKGAMVVAVYAASGVGTLVWVTTGPENCPLCDEMEGRTVKTGKPFVKKGGTVKPKGDTAPLTAKHDTMHTPLHDGCDCEIMAR